MPAKPYTGPEYGPFAQRPSQHVYAARCTDCGSVLYPRHVSEAQAFGSRCRQCYVARSRVRVRRVG